MPGCKLVFGKGGDLVVRINEIWAGAEPMTVVFFMKGWKFGEILVLYLNSIGTMACLVGMNSD